MKSTALWIVGLALVAIAAVWFNSHDLFPTTYAASDAQDRELAQADVSEPPPAAVVPAKADLPPDGQLPQKPLPYDQLNKQANTELPPAGPPENKSDDKSVFY